ncbi:Ribosomal large subunit pseudouridine synthase C [Candidatus Kinetoplastibacterium sorsogonicusi]|uniref:Pseudouridine synthase n=1 Tax=Candidatus Kinetoplastidibacterium kentomonadis TaxID=1576550 RepID=A0A3Q8EUF6_9PROT|nr:RluA family pseudouridine synthase [Candidatus Kinetoplastibacterium sorsogonicusi]AWD32562.1 Ribosomal large subunit pseudouridine synthase C [Candidatus Kinetoplastibacterium sorsogonicusi]
MKNVQSDSNVSYKIVDIEYQNQRIDNFLFNKLKNIPKARIYKAIRSGEVRVNKSRISNTYKIQTNDIIRIPPIKSTINLSKINNYVVLENKNLPNTIYEDEYLLVINKPSGLAVHGGSGIKIGLIEQLRSFYCQYKFLELCHRIDRDTSGIVMIAKKRSFLLKIHELFRENYIKKYYVAIVNGNWVNKRQHIKLKLSKWLTKTGERRVKVDHEGKFSHTIVNLRKSYKDYSILDIELCTGRTHQIRVHLSHLGFPIIGDDKYNKYESDKISKRLYLHANKICFTHPISEKKIELIAPLPEEYSKFIK